MLQANKQRKEKCVYACGVVVAQVGEGGGFISGGSGKPDL